MAIHTDLHARFCRNLRQRRKELGLTQTDLAKALGVKQPVIAALEGGRNNPSLDRVEEIAKALSLSPDALFLLDSSPAQESFQNRG